MIKIGNVEVSDFPLLLAPMEDVSDPPFRQICKKFGADLVFTEFISSEGLIRNAIKSIKKLDIFDTERPVGIQIFGAEEQSMIEATKIALQVNPDIIDINFGCPVKKVVCKGAGAAILKDIPKMQKLAEMVVNISHKPVTVKTRLGWDINSIKILEVCQRLQDAGIKAISIHARTRNQMYKGESDWNYISDVINSGKIKIPIFGNGDINSPEKAFEYKNKYGVDGIMIGRASIGNPWIFSQIKSFFLNKKYTLPDLNLIVDTCIQHLKNSIAWKGDVLGILEMRRFYAGYLKGIPNIKDIRNKLVLSNNHNEIIDILNNLKIIC